MNDTLTGRLAALHDEYVYAVNVAVSEDDNALVERLAADYDREALALMRDAA